MDSGLQMVFSSRRSIQSIYERGQRSARNPLPGLSWRFWGLFIQSFYSIPASFIKNGCRISSLWIHGIIFSPNLLYIITLGRGTKDSDKFSQFYLFLSNSQLPQLAMEYRKEKQLPKKKTIGKDIIYACAISFKFIQMYFNV